MKLAPLTLLVPVLAAAGCHGCHDDHPYVPYTIGSGPAEPREAGAAAGPTASASSSVADAAAPFAGEAAVAAPVGRSVWPVGGVVLQAPPGMVFVSAVVRDFDGDGAADAFAIARPPEGNDPGVLVYYRGAPHVEPGDAGLAALTTFSPALDGSRATGCTTVDRLVAVGRRSVLVELGAQCPPHAGHAPDRWLAVLAGGATPRVRMAATIVDPPGAPSLTVEGDAADRDGDGLEDVALRVTLEGGSAPLEPGPRVGATLAWLDRPAGLSRDAAATEASFATLAGLAAGRAKAAKEAAAVPPFVAQMRALWRAVCADGGAPRLLGVSGTGAISCGSTRALEEAGLAEVRAYVTLGDPLRAALSLDRAESPPASRTAARMTEARGWIEQIAPLVAARGLRAVSAVPQSGKGHEPAWGALTFEPSGKLLVRTRAGVVRVDADAGDESSADDVTAWPAAVTSPDGALRWIETYDACDGVALHATFAGGDDVHDVALPVAPSLGDRCSGSRGAPARALAVAWGPGGLEAIVEGQPLLVTPDASRASLLAALPDSSPAARGAPRSPDGKVLVAATSVGLLVRSASRARLYRAPELDGTWSEQRDCAVSNDATHVACVRAGKVWVGGWDAP